MSSFKEFMNKAQELSNQALPSSNISLASIQTSLATSINEISSLFLMPDEEQQFSDEVSRVVQNEAFLCEFSDQIGEPLQNETEDEFVGRGSDVLRKMLYKRFGIKG